MINNFKKIENIIKKGVKKGDFPGAQYCFIENGIVQCGFDGYKQLYPSKIPLKGNEIYDIASLSKIISTTTLILQLIDENKLEFETKVKNILPHYFDDSTTIYQLLTHQSGLPAIVSNSSTIFSKDALIKQIYNERFVYEPESNIVYTDVGYKILGFVLEKIYGKPLDEIAEEKIFNKIEMNNTTYNPNHYKSVPTEYRDDKLIKGYVKGFVHDERSYLLNGLSGHAGLFSNAKDISKYILSILEYENLLSTKMKNKIFDTTVIKKDLNNNELVRSIGFQKFQDLNNTHKYLITHTGFTGCNMWIDVKNKRGFVLLSNAIHPLRKNNKIFSYRKEILNLFYN